MKYIFAIDVDGVLRNNLGTMVDLYNSHFNDNKCVDDIKDFRTEISFPRIMAESGMTSSQWFFQEHSKEIFLDAEPYNSVADDIKELQKYGEVFIITYQKTYLNKMQTLEWLEKNNIHPDGICFAKDKTVIECDYFIDDNDWNLNGYGAKVKCGVLITAPYNKHINEKELSVIGRCDEVVRFDSLHSFVLDFISKRGEDKKRIDFYNRDGYKIWVEEVEPCLWKLNFDKPEEMYYSIIGADDNIKAIDPCGGPFIGVGSILNDREIISIENINNDIYFRT